MSTRQTSILIFGLIILVLIGVVEILLYTSLGSSSDKNTQYIVMYILAFVAGLVLIGVGILYYISDCATTTLANNVISAPSEEENAAANQYLAPLLPPRTKQNQAPPLPPRTNQNQAPPLPPRT